MYRDLFDDKNYPSEEIAVTRAWLSRPSAARALASTFRYLPVTAQQLRAEERPIDVPLALVRSANFDEAGTSFDSEEERIAWKKLVTESWDRIERRGTQTLEVPVIEEANHLTMVRDDRYYPQVVAAVDAVLEAARADA